MRIAIEGCGHGELDKIYETIAFAEQKEGNVKSSYPLQYITLFLFEFHKLQQVVLDTLWWNRQAINFPTLNKLWTSTLDQTLHLSLNISDNPIATLTLYLRQNKAQSKSYCPECVLLTLKLYE